MDKLLIVSLFLIVFETFVLIFILLSLLDKLCNVDETLSGGIIVRHGKAKNNIRKLSYKKKYKELSKRIKTLEEINVDNQNNFYEFDECIEGVKQKYQSMVETVNEVVDDQLQQDAEHERCMNDMYKNFKILSDCFAKECGVAIDFYYPEDKCSDDREELPLNDE